MTPLQRDNPETGARPNLPGEGRAVPDKWGRLETGVSVGLFSRRKGQREEQAVVSLHKREGFEAKRVPLSGAADGFKGDVIVHGLTGESKLRAAGFKQIYSWLGDNDFLTLRHDNAERLYVVPESLWLRLLKDHVNKRPKSPEDAARLSA